MILYLTLILLWVACGALAARIAHAGLKHDLAEKGVPGDTPLGGMWVAWGPVLAGLVALGLFALVCSYIIEKDRLWPSGPPMDLTEGLEEDES